MLDVWVFLVSVCVFLVAKCLQVMMVHRLRSGHRVMPMRAVTLGLLYTTVSELRRPWSVGLRFWFCLRPAQF